MSKAMVSWQAFPSLPSSLRASRVSLVPKTPFPFLFKRLPRRLPSSGCSVINITPIEAKYTLSYKISFISFSSSHAKTKVCPGDDRSIRLKQTDRKKQQQKN